jgi:GT2 family glycosyltransferase
LVSFVDDDNWVCPDWVLRVAEVMSSHPNVGACGGKIEPAFEIAPPAWFDRFKGNYAIGAQAEAGGDVTDDRGYLWGAGLTIRKSAYQGLLARGFSSILTGREGGNLAAGEDAELCLAFRLAGWRLWYDPCLRLVHYVPAARLKWSYLCRIVRGFGSSSVGLDRYRQLLTDQPVKFLRWLYGSWLWQVLLASAKVSIHIVCHPILWLTRREGSTVTLKIEWQLGRVWELVRQRKTYGARCGNVNGASQSMGDRRN